MLKSISFLTVTNAMLSFVWTNLLLLHILRDLPERNRSCMQNSHPKMVVCTGMLSRSENLIKRLPKVFNTIYFLIYHTLPEFHLYQSDSLLSPSHYVILHLMLYYEHSLIYQLLMDHYITFSILPMQFYLT